MLFEVGAKQGSMLSNGGQQVAARGRAGTSAKTGKAQSGKESVLGLMASVC